MPGAVFTVRLTDPEATERLGALLAEILQPGDLVTLSGALGTGKTALARAIVRTICADAHLDVPSPSFALVQPYEAGDVSVLHADLYRIADAREIDELGLLDDPRTIALVEWAERAPELAAQAALAIALDHGVGDEERIAVLGFSGKGRGFAARAKAAGIAVE